MSEKHKFAVAAFCELPLVRRLHQALAMGLAVFMLTLVALREPFRGYLAEVHITGPATAGLDFDDAVAWLKKAEKHLAAVATPAGENSSKSEIRATFVSRHPKPALAHLDELADRWLYQYLPDRLQSHRRGVLAKLRTALNEARHREDAAEQRLEGLRQRQVALLAKGQESGIRNQQPATRPQGSSTVVDTEKPADRVAFATATPENPSDKRWEKLKALKLELMNLEASHTEEHPEVVRLKSQIGTMEQQLGIKPGTSGEAIEQPSSVPGAIRQTSGELEAIGQRKNHADEPNGQIDSPATELAVEIGAVMNELARASRQRQAAEQYLTDRMQELSSEPTAAQWSAGPAHIVTRIGGTPRSLTLALACILASVAGIMMFRATAVELVKPKIESIEELSRAIETPVVGNLGEGSGFKVQVLGDGSQPRRSSTRLWRVITPGHLRIATFVAEGFVAVAAGACLVSVAVDPSLAREVLADPFGTLSEVMGRFGA